MLGKTLIHVAGEREIFVSLELDSVQFWSPYLRDRLVNQNVNLSITDFLVIKRRGTGNMTEMGIIMKGKEKSTERAFFLKMRT